MKPVGGYFELELNAVGDCYHTGAVALNTGRNSFEHILRCKNFKHVYIPFYTCDVLLEPLKRSNTPYSFYHIDADFYPVIEEYDKNAAVLYTNYFGLMNNRINVLQGRYAHLIVDNAQAFYEMPVAQVPTFYSPRKFFGLPDGGFVYNANEIDPAGYEKDHSGDRLGHLITRIENGAEAGYHQYKMNEELLAGQPVRRMSDFTLKLMQGIPFDLIRTKRLSNFHFLHEKLKGLNKLTPVIEAGVYTCPMVYPFFSNDSAQKRKALLENQFFVARYWSNVMEWSTADEVEFSYARDILPLPVDQRYGKAELGRMVEILNK